MKIEVFFIPLRYLAIAPASNGKLYAPPRDTGRVLEIDPSTGKIQEIGEVLEGTKTNENFIFGLGSVSGWF